MGTFLIPADTACHEQVLKKSRFIAYLAHADSPAEAHRFVSGLREQYPDARHVCWAFIAGEPGNTTAVSCSDDGEPAGTAGKPMLNVLQYSGIGEVVVAVVRYFGGIKLGTGGLVRAYSSSVTAVVKIAPTQEKRDQQWFTLQLPYALEDVTRRTLGLFGAGVEQADYAELISLGCFCPLPQLDALLAALDDAGRGQIGKKMADKTS